MKLSKDFTLEELIRSQTAERHGIKEQFDPPKKVIENLKTLCEKVLQPLRDKLAKPIYISSGYRCSRLNALVGGSPSSDHVSGNAVDLNFYDKGTEDNLRLARGIIDWNLPFKQLILEGGSLENPRWIHVAYDPQNKKNKKELLFADFSVRPTAYKKIQYKNGTFIYV
ncbi:MAG: D-Ala-D-Ala carboxypeptidase family metallohydrolase [Flavobacteriales bacterium]|nr:D-Ala-D-Ala carboxypeptidase family metallohydrolase [Flavobacteriales bacterium]MCX7650905.1 D-Ala-D-Ala carboxypeptidase family metallohydrolase [Flavobacteriales bacterium]MDW8432841.1 D-Ala-D-Ala carboxypeptidase family metallohydrolase [Flavobacteriales bacterium]